MLCAAASGQPPCDSLPAPSGPVVDVGPAEAHQLRDVVAAAASGTTILLADGYYDMSGGDSLYRLAFDTPGVTLRSASGDRDAVVLDAGYGTNELVSIHASDVTIASLTLMRAYDHPIHASGSPGAPISGVRIHDVRILDPGQQAIKVNPWEDGYVDDGIVECSSIELTDAGRAEIRDGCYTGGIDAHQARGWVVLGRRCRAQVDLAEGYARLRAMGFEYGPRAGRRHRNPGAPDGVPLRLDEGRLRLRSYQTASSKCSWIS